MLVAIACGQVVVPAETEMTLRVPHAGVFLFLENVGHVNFAQIGIENCFAIEDDLDR